MGSERIKYGILSAIIFDVLGYLLFAVTSYFRYRHFLSPADVFIDDDLWYWWIIWSGLLFFCGYALRKEYEFLAADAKSRFPELEDKRFKKTVRQEFMMLYAKRLTTFFILLPIAYLAAFSPMPPKASNIIIALSLGIPAAAVGFYRARHKD